MQQLRAQCTMNFVQRLHRCIWRSVSDCQSSSYHLQHCFLPIVLEYKDNPVKFLLSLWRNGSNWWGTLRTHKADAQFVKVSKRINKRQAVHVGTLASRIHTTYVTWLIEAKRCWSQDKCLLLPNFLPCIELKDMEKVKKESCSFLCINICSFGIIIKKKFFMQITKK